MLAKFALVFLVALVPLVIGDGCPEGDNVRPGEACKCGDNCLGGTECLNDGDGGLSCQCLPCQYLDSGTNNCKDIPGLGDPCTDVCASNLVCEDEGGIESTCQCPDGQEYDEDKDECVNIPTTAAPTTTTGPTTTGSDGVCIDGTNVVGGCQGLPNGDYPACYPMCAEGHYITCSNGYLYIRPCGLGWYVMPDGTRVTAKLVYDPEKLACERKAAYCPREMDNYIEE